jgi:hypothetical protein
MGVATQGQVDALFNIGGRKLQPNEYIGAIDDVLAQSVKGVMDKLGIQLVKKLEEFSPADSGALQNSFSVIGVKETKGGYRLEINIGVDYADYIDKGVKGIENKRKTYKNAEGKYYQFKTYGMPPEALKRLEGWAARKNIELKAQASIEGRKNLTQITSPAKRLAYYIKKYGIEGRNFKKKAIDAVMPDFNVKIKEIGNNSLILKIVR